MATFVASDSNSASNVQLKKAAKRFQGNAKLYFLLNI